MKMTMTRIFSLFLLVTLAISAVNLAMKPPVYAQGGSNLAPEGVFGETYYAPFAVEIELDGEFDDWEGVPLVYLERGVGGPAISFGAAADNENLYLYADIIDGNIISGEHGTDYWNEDSVEFYLNGTGDLDLNGYTDGVFQLTIPALNRGLPPEEVVLAGVRGETAEATVVAVETDAGWAVEVAVPLQSAVWDITPEHEAEIGFQVHLNDASELNRDTKIIWSVFDPGDQSYQNPSLFGKLIFYEATSIPVVMGEYQFYSALDDDGTVDDFENGIWLGQDDDAAPLGLVPAEDAALSIRQVVPASELALADQDEANNVLAIEGSGFQHVFTDGDGAISQDWSAYNALGFWYYGAASGSPVTAEIWSGNVSWAASFNDETSGWQYVIIPFDVFSAEGGDGPNLAQVGGYGFRLASGSAYLDNVKLFVVENTSGITTGATEPTAAFVIDESIGWETRDWTLTWADEFEGDAGTAINDANWTCETGGHGWGNNEMEYYTQRLENVSLDGGGNLAIVARAENPEDYACHYGRCAFTSARCITADKVEFTYGRVEARIKIPYGQGIWPAFWMLGGNFAQVGWPNSGEIDILENIGREPKTVHGTVHGPGYSGASGIGGSYELESGADFSEDFHVYAVEWDENVIRWYVDGVLFNTFSENNLRGREWVYDHDFFILLNVAVGGYWPGFPDTTTEFPQTMLVDYVRVYQLTSD